MALRDKVVSALWWTAGSRLLSQAVTWAITIVVIRLLKPADYGLLAMAMVFVNFLVLLAEAGLGAAVVQAREMDQRTVGRVFGAVILINGVFCLLQIAAAPAIAAFFGEERLANLVRVLAVQFPLMSFAVIPVALLSRAMEFKCQAVIECAAAISGSLCTLALAVADYGLWSIVAGNLVAQLCKTVAINAVAPCSVRPEYSFSGLRELVTFGGQVTAARVLWFVYSQADVFIAGKLLGKDMLGAYSVAIHFSSLPVQKLSAVVNQVAFPAFAELQGRPEIVRQHVLKAVRMLSFVSFPVLWGISSISPEIVDVLLGEHWASATLPLQILPLVMPLSMLSPFFNVVFQGLGRAAMVLRNVATACFLMPIGFLVGARWGVDGLAFAWIIVFPLVFAINLRRMLPQIGLRVANVVAEMAPSAIAGAVMYVAVAVGREACSGRVPPVALMALLIVIGGCTYAVAALLMNRAGVREMQEMVARSRSETRAA